MRTIFFILLGFGMFYFVTTLCIGGLDAAVNAGQITKQLRDIVGLTVIVAGMFGFPMLSFSIEDRIFPEKPQKK